MRLLAGSVRIVLTLLVAGFCGVMLVRFAPGFGTDERELNAHLSSDSIAALRVGREANVARIYGRFLSAGVHGDLGISESLNTPVAGLLAERFPLTLRSAGVGLAAAWALALLLAASAAGFGKRAVDWAGMGMTEVLLAVPAGLVALLLFIAFDGSGFVPSAGVALVVFPHLYRNQRQLLGHAAERPHVLSAHARGVKPWRVFCFEVFPGALPQLLALAGTSVTLAIGSAIPIETICDSPGIGQLAWKAATARDLGLLLPLILMVTGVTLTANFVADQVVGNRKAAVA